MRVGERISYKMALRDGQFCSMEGTLVSKHWVCREGDSMVQGQDPTKLQLDHLPTGFRGPLVGSLEIGKSIAKQLEGAFDFSGTDGLAMFDAMPRKVTDWIKHCNDAYPDAPVDLEGYDHG